MKMALKNFVSLIIALAMVSGFSDQPREAENLVSRISLLPRPEPRDADNKRLLKSIHNALKTKELEAIATAKSFPKWKTFEDNRVIFRYPDDPRIVLEVKLPNDKIPVEGSPVGTTDNAFAKCYRLVLGDKTCALLLLNKSEEFDDGICLCGAVVYEKYLFHNGALCRFSFLANGDVKKAQMTRGGFRLIMFEWTHSLLSQEAYMTIAESVTLKNGPCDQSAAKKAIFDKYGFCGRLGFLEKGMTRDDALALLGKPARSDKTRLTYVQTEDRRQRTVNIDFPNGVFQGFGEDWQRRIILPAKRGSLAWILETMSDYQESAERDTKQKLSPDTIKYIFDRFVELAPTAAPQAWDSLCCAIHKLHELGHADNRVLAIVQKRFLEKEIPQHYAAWVLDDYDAKGNAELFAQRIRLSLDEARKMTGARGENNFALSLSPYMDFSNLIGFLDESHPQRVPLLLEAMDHPNPQIRQDAYLSWRIAPPETIRSRLVRGLEDPSQEVRHWASYAFSENFGAKDDLPLLKRRLAVETDKQTVKNLQKAIERLEKKKDNDKKKTEPQVLMFDKKGLVNA